MANTLTNFLIGIGYDYDDKGEKKVKAGMESIKSSTLAIGSAMSAAAIGAGYQVDKMAEKSRKLQDQLYRSTAPTTWVQGYGAALKELGGDADDAANRVLTADKLLAALRMGDAGTFDALGKAGFDAGYLAQSKDAQEFITRSAERFATVQSDALTTQTQYRLNMAGVLGLTDAEFKLWEQGGAYVDTHSKQLAKQLGYTEDLNTLQYQYSQSWVALNLELDRAGNTVSNIMLPGMTKLVGLANEYVGAFTDFAQKNPQEAQAAVTGAGVAAAGTGVAGLGALAGKLGLPGAGVLRAAGPLGAAAGVSIAAEPWLDRGLNSLFGESEYFQRIRTAPTWSEFGNAIWGGVSDAGSATLDWLSQPSPMRQPNDRHMRNINRNRNSYTSGAGYEPSVSLMSPHMNGNQNVPSMYTPKIENKVNMTATIELDGQKIGELIDNRINENNLNTMQQITSQVDR